MTTDSSIIDDDRTSDTPVQFSVWAIHRTTAFAAGWFAAFRIWPHIAVFLLSVWLAFWSTRLLFRLRGKGASLLKRGICCTLVMFFWAVFYVASMGPFIAFVVAREIPPTDLLFILLAKFYLPVELLHDAMPYPEIIESYGNAWIQFGSSVRETL